MGQAIGTRADTARGPGDEVGDGWRNGPGPIGSHVLAVLWLLATALAYLGPALARGSALGDYELLSAFGFGTVPNTPLHNVVSSDQIQEMIPWTDLSWVQVHAGHLPMWNPFAGLGLPLAFNFQSAPFSLTTAVAYLFPLHLAYTVTVVAKLLVAGTGVLFLARVLGLRVVAATFAGTVFELSGAFTAWLGWPHAGVFCWLGWILGFMVLLARGRQPTRWAALMAVAVALSVLGGHPESIIISLVCCGVFAVAMLAGRAVADRQAGGVIRMGAGFIAGVVGGLALAAPVLGPGLQVIAGSSHTTSKGYSPLPHTNLVNLATSTFYGLPVLHHTYFGARNYYEAASYVGLGALSLAAVALVCCWRRIEVLSLIVVGVVCAALVYSATVASAVGATPGVNLILWDRAVIPLDMVLAVLAGVGLQAVVDRREERLVRATFAAVAALAAALVVVLLLRTVAGPFSGGPALRRERLGSLLVPGVEAAAGVIAAGLLLGSRRLAGLHARPSGPVYARSAAGLIVLAELVFLLTATPELWSSAPRGFVTTAAERAYQKAVGPERVGFAACPSLVQQPNLGILAEANSAFGVAELAAYDPVVPKAWFQAWGAATGHPGVIGINNFCASVDSVALAREFGVAAILVPPGTAAPVGARLQETIDGVGVWRVPGSGLITEGPAGAAPGAPQKVLEYRSPAPGRYQVDVDPARGETIRFHISDVPGWQATVDGRAVPVRRWADAMMAVAVGPGRHRVTLDYHPEAWTLGLWVSLVAGVVVAAFAIGPRRLVTGARRLRRPAK